MIHYICPICDLELKGGHFCPTCKKWIREPVIYNGECMPNEHSDDCFLERVNRKKEPVANVSREYTKQAPRRTTGTLTARQAQPRQQRPVYTPNQSPTRRGSTGKSTGLVVLIVWLIIVFLLMSFAR